MRVRKIQLKNGYKRFLDLTIDLGDNPKRIIALVGPNGCGKSSVLDGMLFHANSHSQIGNKQTKGYEYHSMSGVPNYSYENILINFVEGTYQQVWQSKTILGKEKTIFSFRSPYRYNSKLKIKETRTTSELRLNSYGASTASDLDDKMEENYRRLHAKYNKYLNETDCKPSEARNKIIGDLNKSLGQCLNIAISELGDIESARGTLYFKKPDHPISFEFDVLSSGEKEVIDILLDLYLRQDEYNDTVFLLDEPELHISTSIQKKLLIEINKLIGKDCQLWITTHSIGFLRALQEDLKEDSQIIHFDDTVNLASKTCILEPKKNSYAGWKEIFQIALDDLCYLTAPKRIIYCEGRDMPGKNGTERGFDAKVFNNLFSEKYSDTLFVSSGGNTELDRRSDMALAILTKVLNGVEILVLKDRDTASGKENLKNHREMYLKNNSSNHRMLNRFEIENYLFDKEVLRKYCLIHDLEFKEVDYDNFVKNIQEQNIKDELNRIKNFCSINFSINSEVFKLELSKLISEDMPIFRELEDCIFNIS
jgi:predicted ATPase